MLRCGGLVLAETGSMVIAGAVEAVASRSAAETAIIDLVNIVVSPWADPIAGRMIMNSDRLEKSYLPRGTMGGY